MRITRFERQNLALFFILLLAAFLRFWELGGNPPALTWDEVAWGYNAYALGIDGKDEFGRFLPLNYLESFGDFKPPFYAYLAIIPVKLFGLTEFAVRFPSALFGTLTIFVTYFLTKRIFFNFPKKEAISLLSALFLAISPWHINLSRAAFEANVATFFIVVGMWAFLAGVQEKKWNLVLSTIAFVLSIYTFNTARIVSPILFFLLLIIFHKHIVTRKKEAFFAACIGFLLFIPIVNFLLSPQASLRFKEVNIFSDIKIIHVTNQEMANDGNALWSKILHNRRLAFTFEYIRHYFDHFNSKFLFITGDGNPKFSTQDIGQMYIWDIPFFIMGILFLFRQKPGFWWLLFAWLLIGIIPAATARETPHALRIEASLPTFQILTAFGFLVFLTWANKYIGKKRIIFITTVIVLLFINATYYLHGYYIHYPREYSGEWQYGYKQALQYVNAVQEKYRKVYITDELGRPHIYYAFYAKLHPDIYRKTATVKRDTFGFVTVPSIGRNTFTKYFDVVTSEDKKNVLFLDIPANIPPEATILKTFYLLNGKPALIAYKVS